MEISNLKGKVIKQRVSRGSKSEHAAYALDTGDKQYTLRMKGGPAFGDDFFAKYLGEEIEVEGVVTGKSVIVNEISTGK